MTTGSAPTPTFSVEYNLYPPPIDPPIAGSSKLPPKSAISTIPISVSVSDATSQSESGGESQRSETSKYYSTLSQTLKQAQKELNDKLTVWKDSIGDREKSKEDPGTIGFGRGKAAIMSEDVRGELRQNDGGEGDDSDSSDES